MGGEEVDGGEEEVWVERRWRRRGGERGGDGREQIDTGGEVQASGLRRSDQKNNNTQSKQTLLEAHILQHSLQTTGPIELLRYTDSSISGPPANITTSLFTDYWDTAYSFVFKL